jgi:hypothetical protein
VVEHVARPTVTVISSRGEVLAYPELFVISLQVSVASLAGSAPDSCAASLRSAIAG